MYRLSLKLFLVLAFVAGPVLGFAPDASAHKATRSIATVVGSVEWPANAVVGVNPARTGPPNILATKAAYGLGRATDAGLAAGLALESRELNGCRLLTANPGDGLPLGVPGESTTVLDLCFSFSGLTITLAGQYKGVAHVSDLDCESSGTSTPAAGGWGSFYGEYVCGVVPGTAPAIGSADGHFHGISVQAPAIAFLGELMCTVTVSAVPCPPPIAQPVDAAWKPGMPVVSDTKHTLACKGVITPAVLDKAGAPMVSIVDKPGSATVVPDVLLRADVELTCLVA